MYSKKAMKQRILLTGKDGIDLLQRITTLDFKRLTAGVVQSGLFLNAQGKILCHFTATRIANSDSLEIEFENQFLELLDQYTFSERYEISKLPVTSKPDSIEGEMDRIRHRIPKEGNEFLADGQTNPLEINLQTAIHDQKGCYPGQEVIEKIIAIGSPAKRLCLVQITDENKTPASLPLELDFGKLTSFSSPFGLAIVRKTHTTPGTILKSQDHEFKVVE
jgi:folate-binding protein YgfZ